MDQVQVPTHSKDDLDLLQRIREDVSTIVDMLDTRFVYVIKECVRGLISSEGVVGELSLLSRELKRCFRRLVEVEERQDISFRAATELRDINQHCVWLFRRILVQQAFLRKLSLEAKLRGLVSREAFNIYETLLNLDEEEREVLASDEVKIRTMILEERNQSDILPPGTG